MIATPKAKTVTNDGWAYCESCGRKLVHLPNFGWLHLHVKIRDHPRYCR